MSNLQRVVRPETGIQHQEDNCKLHIDRTEFGIGTLYISEDRLIWENPDNRGLSLAYKDIAIHAISKDLQVSFHLNIIITTHYLRLRFTQCHNYLVHNFTTTCLTF